MYYPFSASFSWSTMTHSQFAPCQQQPGSTAQKLGIGWVKLYQSNTDPLEIQHSLNASCFQALDWVYQGQETGRALRKGWR